ncbi:hypothetical protein C8J55DRAFT_488323 [Lentinula edodes]|uniref:Uncharacterized protein n=1 Tax=Lentinula lateritia TaxID=40482 RepID=A0A9W9DRA3_9AGAR|nr:hypothetical protein C8J55DRAFT_488323 [Lentinula edodes]
MEEKTALLRWAKEFRESYPFIPQEEIARRRKAKEEEMAKEKAASTFSFSPSSWSSNVTTAAFRSTGKADTNYNIYWFIRTCNRCGSANGNDMANATLPVMPTTNAVTTANGAGDERVHSLTVGHGQVLTYKYSHIHCVWDDERPNWDPVDCAKNLLEINGMGIALRYWQEVFSGKKNKVWSWLKKLWIEWKYVAECYRSRGPEQFWQDFSFSTGEHFHWKAITNQLRDLRSERDQQLVDKAKAEYGDRFSQVFVNNRGKVVMDKSAIARRYLEELHYHST